MQWQRPQAQHVAAAVPEGAGEKRCRHSELQMRLCAESWGLFGQGVLSALSAACIGVLAVLCALCLLCLPTGKKQLHLNSEQQDCASCCRQPSVDVCQ